MLQGHGKNSWTQKALLHFIFEMMYLQRVLEEFIEISAIYVDKN